MVEWIAMDGMRIDARDRETAERQLGRPLRGEIRVASRCPHGVVQVIATPPLLPDGTPFPTLFWLTCPLLQRSVSRLESGDFRHRLRGRMREDPGFGEELSRAEREYAALRAEWAERLGAREDCEKYFSPRGGIGGTASGGTKCLHAHLAHFLAGGGNPVGAEVARELGGIQESECGGDCAPFLRGRR
ncbi:MAG: DUF501 domain-containing protein [Actinomycetota bacterium]|nr:DUF501 domain-containing protein [Actinomycetota bacterium]